MLSFVLVLSALVVGIQSAAVRACSWRPGPSASHLLPGLCPSPQSPSGSEYGSHPTLHSRLPHCPEPTWSSKPSYASSSDSLSTSLSSTASTKLAQPTNIDASNFASTANIRSTVDEICHSGLRLPGSPNHLAVVDYVKRELSKMPGITTTKSDFKLANWQPFNNSIYESATLKIGANDIDVVGSIAYSLPTNGSAVSGQLVYYNSSVNLSTVDIKGKIILRDYAFLNIPTSLFKSVSYLATDDITTQALYTRPFLTPPNADLLACSLGGAAGYISAFNVSRKQLEGYYSGHAGTHWLVPGVFTGAEQYQTLRNAASANEIASIRIDATSGSVMVPRLMATLPGQSDEAIIIATHTDGVTYVQENGPAALLKLAEYFSKLPLSGRAKTIKFAFEASHLAYQKDSDKTLALALDADYDLANSTTAFVIAIEHLGTRGIESYPATNGTPGHYLNYSGTAEPILWAVGEVKPGIDAVLDIVKTRNLTGTIVSPGFPPPNPANMVPTYPSMGGLGTYYTNALVPTMSLISGPWSLWAPRFGREALDYERLRTQYLAIGDAVLQLSRYSKAELAGNYTRFRQERASGEATTITINTDDAQFITGPGPVYY